MPTDFNLTASLHRAEAARHMGLAKAAARMIADAEWRSQESRLRAVRMQRQIGGMAVRAFNASKETM